MTYTQLAKRVYGPTPVDATFWDSVDEPTRQAWSVMQALHARKGFGWWFDDIHPKVQDSIFADVRNAIKKSRREGA